MYDLTIEEIIKGTGGKLVKGNLQTSVNKFSINSRTLEPLDIFIAIKGNRFNGHRFVGEGIEKGALGIIVDHTFEIPEKLPEIVIKVEDTLGALGDIARIVRMKFQGPIIAVTGTVGKTTTKEVIASVLSEKYCVHKTKGTLNNKVGVPLTLCQLNQKHGVGIIELGMSELGEIEYLTQISQPDVGVITNVGPAHLEQLHSIENIARAKSELIDVMGSNGLLILNKDCDYFDQFKKKVRNRLVTIGRSPRADFQAIDIKVGEKGNASFKILVKPFHDILEIELPVVGIHNVYTALIAVAIGYGLGMGPERIISGLSKIKLPSMRLEVREVAGIKIINDCYNANPVSMRSALETLSALKTSGKKIFVCGDMLELGDSAHDFHKEIGKLSAELGTDKIITIGELSKIISEGTLQCGMDKNSVRHCKNNIEAVTVLSEWLEPGDIVLVKGSRANYMEQISRGIEEYYSTLDKLIV